MKLFFDQKAIAIILMIIVFIIDLLVPPGVPAGVLYLGSTALVFNTSKKTIFWFSSVASFLMMMDLLVHFELHTTTFAYTDKLISISAIWLFGFIALKYISLNKKNESQLQSHLRSVDEILFMATHKVRRPVCNIQGMGKMLTYDNPTKEEMIRICEFMKRSITELDDSTRELTLFMDKIKMNAN